MGRVNFLKKFKINFYSKMSKKKKYDTDSIKRYKI